MAATTKSAKGSVAKNGAHARIEPGEVLTLAEAAAYLRIREEDVVRMVQSQGLAGRQIGDEWRFLKASLQAWLAATPPASKNALLDLAGKFKDDPYLEELTREAYRRRGRPMTEQDE